MAQDKGLAGSPSGEIQMFKRFSHICLLALSATALLTACETTDSYSAPVAQDTRPVTASVNALSTTNMNQLAKRDGTLDTTQIMTSARNNLTIDQLKVYADRCRPDANLPVPADLDCSEIRLRMKRVFKSDDKVAEALFTLNRLSQTSQPDSDIDGDFTYGSLNSQAVAGQVLQDNALSAPEPEADFADFLEANGLSVESGAIVIDSGGG
ncbi:hypothetical protein ACJ3XI_06970 [Litorimonas sp. RW-G-Af-16]|uniref:hypothetical protein n=1 Tax=Litorimonas sp. RW-G-Af-16 TaxID=3241168 RepID=UPI00390CB01F